LPLMTSFSMFGGAAALVV
jgi:hypothetical protein